MTEDNGDPGDGEDRDGGTNFVRCLAPTGELETPARNDTPLQYPGQDLRRHRPLGARLAVRRG